MRMRNLIVAVALSLAAAPGLAEAQGVRISFAEGQYALTVEARDLLTRITPEVVQVGDVAITGHADSSESTAATEAVAALRAHAIAGLLMRDSRASVLRLEDGFFAPGGAVVTPAGARLLDQRIAAARQRRGFLVFVRPQYGQGPLAQQRANALATALFARNGTWISADADDFPPGGVEASEALAAELVAFRATLTQPAVVVPAWAPMPAEGSAALTTLALYRASMVRDHLVAGGVPSGRVTVRSAGASNPSPRPAENRWAEIVAAPSGW